MTSNINITSTTSSSPTTASVYGTTPGGTPRISYSRDQLLQLASSPLSRSPPTFEVPAAISRTPKVDREEEEKEVESNANGINAREEEEGEEGAFRMDL